MIRKVTVDAFIFTIRLFGRDEVFRDRCAESAFLDLETGDVFLGL